MSNIEKRKFNISFLLISIIIIAWISIAQVVNNSLLIWSCLASFVVLATFSAVKGMVVPLFLFFLPWSPLLKGSPGTMSVYTVSLFLVLLITLFESRKQFDVYHIFPAMLLISLTLVVKLLYGYDIDNGYILFCSCLLVFPLLSKEIGKNYDFYIITLFFALGIITAALLAKQLSVFPTISRYITVHSYQSLTRLSGFYGDPNFYSAHITAALSGVFVLLLKEQKFLRRLSLFVLTVILLYCGLLSTSKSFILIFVGMLLVWGINLLFVKGKVSLKVALILGVCVCAIIVLSSTVFVDMIDMIFERFNDDNSISALTTGRTDIWINYLNEFESDSMLFLFGKGYSDVLLDERGSHNIFLQIIYQFGVVGMAILSLWVFLYSRMILRGTQVRYNMIMDILVILAGVFGPWLAIDMLKFDEFFLLQFYVYFGIYNLSEHQSDKITEVYQVKAER